MELPACRVPATQDLDRVVRLRSELRTNLRLQLRQLERTQPMQLGQPVLLCPNRVRRGREPRDYRRD